MLVRAGCIGLKSSICVCKVRKDFSDSSTAIVCSGAQVRESSRRGVWGWVKRGLGERGRVLGKEGFQLKFRLRVQDIPVCVYQYSPQVPH